MAAAEDRAVCVLVVHRDSSEIVATRFLLARVAEARFVVEEADSLSAALQRLAREGVDIVLMDSKLAGSPGLETPALTTLKNFRGEFEAHVREGRCTVPAPWRRRHAAPAHSH